MIAHPVCLQMKYTNVILGFAQSMNISVREALDFFYRSKTYQLMSRGISDMHCRSDGYLAEDLAAEYKESMYGGDPVL